ncbi:MAG: ergothioneine biosynthesis protein EgtB [Saprospiraceae bacterium]
MHANTTPSLSFLYKEIRNRTETICASLQAEDYMAQPIIDVSPPKWHLAHTSWFFETFILKPSLPRYKEFHPDFSFFFNSYYNNVGSRVLRPNRGNMTRPTVAEVYAYRKYVDDQMELFFSKVAITKELENICLLGFNHEQQHQELLVTDIKYILGNNPLFPALSNNPLKSTTFDLTESYLTVDEGIYTIGYQADGFHFDNEKGIHKVFLHSFRCQDRLTTNGEYLEFMKADAYRDFNLWLSDGWEWVNGNQIYAPMYWFEIENEWHNYTLQGMQKIDLYAPVTHISFYEAEAYARWRGKRLLTEFEWEIASNLYNPLAEGTFLEDERYAPAAKKENYPQFLGDVWEWTNSSYLPYPYFTKAAGAIGEYNGKFMIDQMVLRGGSCATPKRHIRPTYRNFFQPRLRWQFTGIRLAEHI